MTSHRMALPSWKGRGNRQASRTLKRVCWETHSVLLEKKPVFPGHAFFCKRGARVGEVMHLWNHVLRT